MFWWPGSVMGQWCHGKIMMVIWVAQSAYGNSLTLLCGKNTELFTDEAQTNVSLCEGICQLLISTTIIWYFHYTSRVKRKQGRSRSNASLYEHALLVNTTPVMEGMSSPWVVMERPRSAGCWRQPRPRGGTLLVSCRGVEVYRDLRPINKIIVHLELEVSLLWSLKLVNWFCSQ